MKRFRALLMVISMFGAGAVMLIAASPAASAAGYGGKAEYQLTISDTCNNASYCGADNLGGAWGWIALYANGTGDGQLTFCGHGPSGSGAGHEALDISSWSIDSANGVFFIGAASDPTLEGDTPFPATPGHYNMHPAPGVEIEVTVALNPTS